ncbi:tektin-2-like [Plodia interpunctella]|uniref:tektin-2-like n=1 Tax=Plodia interpunctella TaxID=58824 RepID=UPI00236778E7|nr:tektin-2-like [Plodia interpunctella]
MFSEDGYIGCPRGIERLRSMKDRLSDKVLEQVNDCQELVMLNSFSREASEYQIKKSLQQRIADIASWRWVLEDLSRRLDDGIAALKHEHNALRVVVQRLQNEINDHSREASRPGALKPRKDIVEDAIMEEYNFLREQKKNFERMIPGLDKQTAVLEKTKKRIETDLKCKQEAITVEESCAKIDINSLTSFKGKKNRKRSFSPLCRWENRCASLKRAGINALSNAVITRQQVRGARVQLSIAAQSFGAKVDAALRRRLHNNTAKLQELQWQREEAVKDLGSLDEELIATEQNILETMDQERVVEARLADRTLRPAKETTRDEVDKSLRDELARLKTFNKRLQENIEKIARLQNNLNDTISRIDCCAEDLAQVVRLDQDRMAWRLGEQVKCDSGTDAAPPPRAVPPKAAAPITVPSYFGTSLRTIKEEDEEEDDYPFDD